MFKIKQYIFEKVNIPGLSTSMTRFIFDRVLRNYLNYATHSQCQKHILNEDQTNCIIRENIKLPRNLVFNFT